MPKNQFETFIWHLERVIFYALIYLLTFFIDLFFYFSLANTTDSLSASGLGTHRNWLQGLPDSPLIQPVSEGSEGSGQKELKLRFDVSQYSPEEIVVKTVDNKLLVRICYSDSFFTGSNNPNTLLLEFWYILYKKARKTRKVYGKFGIWKLDLVN